MSNVDFSKGPVTLSSNNPSKERFNFSSWMTTTQIQLPDELQRGLGLFRLVFLAK